MLYRIIEIIKYTYGSYLIHVFEINSNWLNIMVNKNIHWINFIDDIFRNKIDDNITKNVVEFYDVKPFPNYHHDDNKASILNKGDKNYLAKKFKKFAGFNKKILEVGCGTGQLSIYFSIGTNNEIVALDPTLESLKLASKFTKDNNIKNVKFLNADIFDDVLTDEYFDFIWTNGVLHHTKNPKKGFEMCVKALKKDIEP